MRVVQGDQVQPQPAVRYRPGSLTACILLEGTPGTPGNFQLSLGITGADFLSPRHRHNFEQYRCVLQGGFDFARDGKMRPGMVGYFPEGVYYGPQSSAEDTVAAVLQFGGVSGNGYLGAAEVNAGMAALQQHGVFEKGSYHRTGPDTGQRSQDGFEAIWEHVNRRPITYSASGAAAPVLRDPAEMEWSAVPGAPGVRQKSLADFPAAQTGARLLKLEPGAGFTLHGRGVFLVISGAGQAAETPVRRLTAFDLEPAEAARLTATEELTLLHYILPDLSATCAGAVAA
jgi:hypothetical protein